MHMVIPKGLVLDQTKPTITWIPFPMGSQVKNTGMDIFVIFPIISLFAERKITSMETMSLESSCLAYFEKLPSAYACACY